MRPLSFCERFRRRRSAENGVAAFVPRAVTGAKTVIDACAGFFRFGQCFDRPALYGTSSRLQTIPSKTEAAGVGKDDRAIAVEVIEIFQIEAARAGAYAPPRACVEKSSPLPPTGSVNCRFTALQYGDGIQHDHPPFAARYGARNVGTRRGA